ncbi:hypothetical protein [Falsiroseomonas tokyonensis]|uniref:DUF1795 domain-containing protein n=1 Tax=Falsiroseomonas tokyonensis TaxID=430521 RepID=A0ABV7BT68_9PROT|nr:hypothetical protein [Falsiroseomonas tokyonensis]MBU8538838.1 hypothetical protein [Falsiroseomonas tokyonensis]
MAKDPGEEPAPGAHSAEFLSLQALPPALAQIPRAVLEEDRTPGVLSGAIAAYRAPGISVTIYLFRRSAEPVPEGPDSLPVLSKLISASAAAREVLGQRLGPRVEARLARMAVRGAIVLCSQDIYRAGPNAVQDFTCVASQDGRLLKLRATFRTLPEEQDQAQRAIASMLDRVRGHLSGGGAAGAIRT